MKRSRRRASAAVMAELREMFSGDVLREIMDITDHGEVVLTQITSKDTTNEPHSDGRDVWTNVTEPLEYDRPHKPRLFHPAGILFRAPKKGESAILLRPKSASGRNAPGFGILLPDGGDGSSSFLPPWWGNNDSGIWGPSGETIHVESKDSDVQLDATGNGKKVYLGKRSGTTQPAVLGNNLESRLAALEAAFNAHTHAYSGTANTTSGAYSGTTLAVAGPQQVQSPGQNIKASKVEVG